MHFFINKNDLLLAISAVEKFVPSKSPMTLLMGIKFELEDVGLLHLSATDENMGIRYTVKNRMANLLVEQPGSVVIPARLLSEMARKLPLGTVEFRQEDLSMHIVAGDFKMVLPCLVSNDFPTILSDDLPQVLEYSQKTFKDMLKKTLFARADENSSRPQLTGVLLELKDSVLNAVALDGYRIAWRWEKLGEGDKDFYCIVPGQTLLETVRVFSDSDDAFKLKLGRNTVAFATDCFVISSRVLEGTFIDYKKVAASNPNTFVTIKTADMLSAAERANLIAREGNKNNLFHMKISQVDLEVEADSEYGRMKDRHACQIRGDSLEISFNATFFIEALKSLESGDVEMSFSGDTGPCIMKPSGQGNYLNYILPVKTRRGDNY